MNPATTHDDSIAVEFRAPLHHRALRIIKALFVTLLLGLVIWATAYWGLNQLWPSTTPPSWALVLAAIPLLGLPVLVVWATDRSEPSRIILHEGGIWIGGRFFGRSALYNDLALIKLEKPEGTIGKIRQVVIERASGSPFTIWFGQADAEQCFEALRTLCEHAPAMDEDRLYAPPDTEFTEEAKRYLMMDFQRSARLSLIAAIAAGVLGVGLIVVLLSIGSQRRGWIGVVFLLSAAIGLAGKSRENWRRAEHIGDELAAAQD